MHQGCSQDFKLGGPRGSRPGGPRANTGGRIPVAEDSAGGTPAAGEKFAKTSFNPIPSILVQKSLKSI